MTDKLALELIEDRILEELVRANPKDDAYDSLLSRLENFTRIKGSMIKQEKPDRDPSPLLKFLVSPTAGALLQTLMVLNYEKVGIITSKAFRNITIR